MKYRVWITLDRICHYFIIKINSLPTKSTKKEKKIYEFTQRNLSTHPFLAMEQEEDPCPGLLP